MSDNSATLETKEDVGPPPGGSVRRWLMELRLADRAERDWRTQASRAYKRYAKADTPRSGFNILWSNTETLCPAIFNSTPRPDVRRRFKDADPTGKWVSDILERALTFSMDSEDFEGRARPLVLDLLLGGRAVCRVRYVPSFSEDESVAWEQAVIDPVHWEDYRQGPGRSWAEVGWIAFRHRLTREECVEKFAETGRNVPLEDVDLGEQSDKEETNKTVWQRATVWEIWDKDEKRVLWLAPAYPDALLKEEADPLKLVDFFPVPRPLLAIERPDSQEPVTLFSQYESQARELDLITRRIHRLIEAVKARGIYDSTLAELSDLFKGEENELIPSVNAVSLAERGGLDKFIWMMPIADVVMALRELIVQRGQLKQEIYEITGISDIMRGASQASETATAQQIKGQWGSMRISRMQRDFQRFLRDIFRIKSEIISERFDPQTLALMTGLQLPSQQVKMMAQMAGQPIEVPSWEEVLQVMRDDSLRSFRIDVETDSTIQQQLAEDQQAFAQGIQAVTGFMTSIAPAVQAGAFPIEAAKAIIMAWARRTKMGREVEDALEQIKAPSPPPPPSPTPPQDNSQQMALEQAKMQQAEQKVLADREKTQGEFELKKIEMAIKAEEVQIKKTELLLREKEIEGKRPSEPESEPTPVVVRRVINASKDAGGSLIAEILDEMQDGAIQKRSAVVKRGPNGNLVAEMQLT